MVSNEEIKRRLELKRKGLDPDKESFPMKTEVHKTPIKSEPKKTITCPKCGTMNLESSKFCISCGNELKKKVVMKGTESKPIICPECGTENTASSKFCIGCGKNLKEVPEEVAKEDINEKIEEVEPADEPIRAEKIVPAEKPDLSEMTEETDDKPIEEPDLSQETEKDITEDEIEKTDFFEEIKKAKELLDMGAITEEEFEKIKNNYLKQFK